MKKILYYAIRKDLFGLYSLYLAVLSQINFRKQYKSLLKQSRNSKARFQLNWDDKLPCLDDNTGKTVFNRQYVYFTGWAMRQLKQRKPEIHTDIGSSLYFIAMASAYHKINFFDYRPADLKLENLQTGAVDLMKTNFETNSIPSLSCLHVLEHIGLGRYGDPVNYDGDVFAFKELARILAVQGILLFVVPVGVIARIEFNAHRIYTSNQVREMAEDCGLTLLEYTLIPQSNKDGGLITSPSIELEARQEHACGCFVFTKHA